MMAVDGRVAPFSNSVPGAGVPGAGWLNPLLVLLPWLRHLPLGLVD